MHQDPEHEDYDDDEYNHYPEYNEYGYPIHSKKFNIDWELWEKFLADTIKDIFSENPNTWIVDQQSTTNNSNQNNKFLFFGKNNYSEDIWKTKYFIKRDFDIFFKNHFVAHAKHILIQPEYYRGLFDILN